MEGSVRGIPRMRITMLLVEEKKVAIGCCCLNTISVCDSL
jgi:hypothetical protein